MNRQIGVVISGHSLEQLTLPELKALIFGNSHKALAILHALRDEVLATVYLTYLDEEASTFMLVTAAGESVSADDLKEVEGQIQDGLLPDESLEKLYLFSTDSGFPMLEVNNF